jgi:hypothetical protein
LNPRGALSLIPLVFLTLIFTAARAVLASHHLSLPGELAKLESVTQQLFVAIWVYLDRQSRRLSLPFEFEAFVFFAWPIALPYYLVKSRGARGLLLVALFFALLVLSSVVAQLLQALAMR